MKKHLLLAVLCGISFCSTAQVSRTDSLLADIRDSLTAPVLLPERMIFTQRALWGYNGLMRKVLPLNLQNRQKEFRVRRTMFNIHQVAGLITLAGYVAQGFIGAQLYKNYSDELLQKHRNMAVGINVAYGITATMALTAPPAIVHRRGLSSAKVHRMLGMLHLTSMIATNILAQQIRKNPKLKPYHKAAAYTTFAAFTVSILVFKFK